MSFLFLTNLIVVICLIIFFQNRIARLVERCGDHAFHILFVLAFAFDEHPGDHGADGKDANHNDRDDQKLTTDDEKQAWAREWYDDHIDNEDTLLFVYFAEQDVDNDVGLYLANRMYGCMPVLS